MIDLYKDKHATRPVKSIPIGELISSIKNGMWRKDVEAVRKGTKEKQDVPALTISGTFKERNNKALIKPSGFICVDLDNTNDIEALKSNGFIYCAFKSVSGNGLAAIVKIPKVKNNDEHTRYYEAISQYLDIPADPSCKNISRLRFVSYDPDIYVNEDAQVWTTMSEKRKAPKRTYSKKTNDTDIEELLSDVMTNNINLVPGYDEWLRIGFAIADYLGEEGREVFHAISEIDQGNYDSVECDKKYDNLLQTNNGSITISTLFHHYNLHTGKTKMPEKEIEPRKLWKKGKRGAFSLDYASILELLQERGYAKYVDDESVILVRVVDNVVEPIVMAHIIDTIIEHVDIYPNLIDVNFYKDDLKNMLITSSLNTDKMLHLPKLTIDFVTGTRTKGYLFFNNGFMLCEKGKDIIIKPYSELDGYIWKAQKMPHNIELDFSDGGIFSKFCFLVAGEKNWLSLKSIIGYMIHDYTEGKRKAVIVTDEQSEQDIANGRTGKGILGQAIQQVTSLTLIPGKTFNKMKNFAYQKCNRSTKVIFIDDINKYFDFESIYNDITEHVEVEKKGKDVFEIKPKMFISCNTLPKISGSSGRDRVEIIELTNHFSDTWSVEDEFGKYFFGNEFHQKDWNQFFTFMGQCLKMYIDNYNKYIRHAGIYSAEKSENFGRREIISQTHADFVDWFEEVFKDGQFINTVIEVDPTFSDKYDKYQKFYAYYFNDGIFYPASWLYESFVYQTRSKKDLHKCITGSKSFKNAIVTLLEYHGCNVALTRSQKHRGFLIGGAK